MTVEIWLVLKLECERRLRILITTDPLITPEQLDQIPLSVYVEQMLRSQVTPQKKVSVDATAD